MENAVLNSTMTSNQIRKAFLDFFKSKQHQIVASAPMVVKNDPTLMFTNAGMNQFKDIFLGNASATSYRIADSQKCLRVSGKHNDLEEVGKDTYHHTMFEMLGNWSFGDYFKEEAIDCAWEFLTAVLKLDKERLYATVFEGDKKDGTEPDSEALQLWRKYLPQSRILYGNKKDNFWEMGDSGPCGPCSEIHIDLRSDEERQKTDGASLVNKDHHLVIEIWNLVFIQFNRLTNGQLQPLADRHVDTGMGFERLCMAVQGKQSNYDTDVFQPLIQNVARLCGKTYGIKETDDIAMRVVVDHLRAVSFAIADGQLPSNTGAGYVIRRILRRAIRYGYTFLGFNEPFICHLVEPLAEQMGEQFHELKNQKQLIFKVIQEEEQSFLRTLASGILKFESFVQKKETTKTIPGDFAFELFDTYGFPIDLTQLLASEKQLDVDMKGFEENLQRQKERSRAATSIETQDWIILKEISKKTEFVGYDALECECRIVKYRQVKSKSNTFFQLVLDITPFYAESGGQLGDQGVLTSANETVVIQNTVKENDLIVHIAPQLPENPEAGFFARVNAENRLATQRNHSATHLLHFALRQVLGTHVEQKGSMVNAERLRFDFSHFSKLSQEEIHQVENMVNMLVKSCIPLKEFRSMTMPEAQNMGAMALFGEKYGHEVRVIKFGDSVELCGGTHIENTGNIGLFKIQSESAIAAGIRRIEAITGHQTEEYVRQLEHLEADLKLFLNSPNILQALEKMVAENTQAKKELEAFTKERIHHLVNDCKNKVIAFSGYQLIHSKFPLLPDILKQAAFDLRAQTTGTVILLTTDFEQKPFIILAFSNDLVECGMDAGKIIKQISPLIQGGGGGQAGLASAGGKNVSGLDAVAEKVLEILADTLNAQ